MSEWQAEQQSQRHFSHRSTGRTRKGNGSNGGKGGAFEPRKMLGEYQIRCAFFGQLCEEHGYEKDAEDGYDMRLFIHELVDTKNGYLASFDFGVIEGVMLIAGSRKTLQAITMSADRAALGSSQQMDNDDTDEKLTEETENQHDVEHAAQHASSASRDESEADQIETATESELAAFERPAELDRPDHAFEKNTFRTPKWFAQWRGVWADPTSASPDSAEHEESLTESPSDGPSQSATADSFDGTDTSNKAHFEFSTAACRQFEATLSCPSIGAIEVPMQGWKVSNKPPRINDGLTWADCTV